MKEVIIVTTEELQKAKAIEARINELNAEIYALFDAPKRIKPSKPFKCVGHIFGSYNSELEITLTHQDIQVLQAIRSAEMDGLKKVLKEL